MDSEEKEENQERRLTFDQWSELIREGRFHAATTKNKRGAGRPPAWLREYQEFLKFKAWKEAGGVYRDTVSQVVDRFTSISWGMHGRDNKRDTKGILQKIKEKFNIDTSFLSSILENPLFLKSAFIPAAVFGMYAIENVHCIPTWDDEGNLYFEKPPPIMHTLFNILIFSLGALSALPGALSYQNLAREWQQGVDIIAAPGKSCERCVAIVDKVIYQARKMNMQLDSRFIHEYNRLLKGNECGVTVEQIVENLKNNPNYKYTCSENKF